MSLYQLRLVDRFQPLDHRFVSHLPYHYVLDQLGAMVLAAERDLDPEQLHWRADKSLAIAKSQRLRHLVGVNGFFSALVAESRRRADCELSLWWSERYCASQFERIALPDGLGRLGGRWRQRGLSASSTTAPPSPSSAWLPSSPATRTSKPPAAWPIGSASASATLGVKPALAES